MSFVCSARRLAVFLLVIFPAISFSQSLQSFRTLATFDDTGGYWIQYTSLVQGRDGNFYGTSAAGGLTGQGVIFRSTPDGALTVVHSFCVPPTNPCPDGYSPMGGLIQGTDGYFYGTTLGGGTYDGGTIFKITASGKLTTLYNFCAEGYPCTNGGYPSAALVQDRDGDFYGTTYYGGDFYAGTIFRITRQGALSKLYSFCAQAGCEDGDLPTAALALGPDGSLYGTAQRGAIDDSGTIFKLNKAGVFEVLHRFCVAGPSCADGAIPYAGLILGSDGRFYGTTAGGGMPAGGTVFNITEDGTQTVLYSVCSGGGGCSTGYNPVMGLVQATDGNFYGSMSWGASSLFEITPSGKWTVLYQLPTSLGDVSSALLQSTNGKFYGTTLIGGENPEGTVFVFDVGLAPFATFVRRWGKIGQTAEILGQGFVGTTSVSFNGVPAEFSVTSGTFLTATIPAHATTGLVTVTTPAGALVSNVSFKILR
jgi:uncharacterized repeat protein (TIGR03803 family)